jgi:di/tricarboxylate transporter
MTTAAPGLRRLRPGPKAMANSAGILVLMVVVAIFPLSAAAHEGMLSNASQVVVFLPIAGVGLVVARRLPRNPIGWLLLAGAAGPLLSAAAGPYVGLVYRLGHRWPFGPLALVLS